MVNMFDRLLGRQPSPEPEADPKPDPQPEPEPAPGPATKVGTDVTFAELEADFDLALVIDSLTETLLQTKLPRSVVDLVDQIAADYDAGKPVGESAAKLLRTLSRRKKVPKKLLGHARTLAALTED